MSKEEEQAIYALIHRVAEAAFRAGMCQMKNERDIDPLFLLKSATEYADHLLTTIPKSS